MHIEKKKLNNICEIMHVTGKYLQGLMGQQSAKEASNQRKLYFILLTWLWRVQKSLLRFCSLNGECACVFVYNAVDVNKIATTFLAKPPLIDKCAISLRVISIAYLFSQSLVNILS